MSYTYQNDPLVFWQHGKPANNCGFGDYEHVGDWSWEFYPFAYSWLAPQDAAPQPAPHLKGFGCSGGCSCGGKCKSGMGQAATGLFGTNLFTTTDFSQWGWGEWTVLGIGAWGALRILSDIAGAGRAVGGTVRKAHRRTKKVAQGLFG